MFIFAPFAFPFVYLFKWLAELFRIISTFCFSLYSKFLGLSMWLNDITELEIWPKE
jgi:hypothetical protein